MLYIVPLAKRGVLEGVDVSWEGCKVFSATKAREREALGEEITRWKADHPEVLQSSDKEFHCLTIVLFYRRKETTS